MEAFLIFPVHLFSNIEKLKGKKVYLIEEPRFFSDFNYHKLKIAYHRASSKYYYDYLKENKIDTTYINFSDVNDNFYKKILKEHKKIYMYNPSDNILKKSIIKILANITIENTLNFLVNEDLISKNINNFYKNGKYNHQNFYKWQRIRLNILVKDGKPIGDKWSFDTENRKKLPKNVSIPKIIKLEENLYIKEAKDYVEKYFKKNYGSLDNFIYPINHEDSKKWLINFIKTKFENFGIYEDAETMRDPFLFHSVLSPMMNIGLLTDSEVLDIVLPYQNKISIESFEGFIRQIIGWRNYLYSIYLIEGDKIKKTNFLDHSRKINNDILWTGNTKLLPVDNIIKKIINYAYAHHIERLMYLGNFLLLCMVNPDDVYKIFMEWTIDAYEWVMIPNVYGMSQFCDGGMIMTRPYFSSSNYILKMSDYKKDEWCKIWDALYYNFINVHEEYLAKNYATSRQVAFWRKKTDSQRNELIVTANKYLKTISK
jgi:deoxyribodipyrimidine photolyase-related protein